MPILDAGTLSFTFNAFLTDTVEYDTVVVTTPGAHAWATAAAAPFFNITVYSFAEDISLPNGTITAVYITDDSFGVGFSINNLPQIPLDTMISPASPINQYAQFWDAVLAGETTIIVPANSNFFAMMGDIGSFRGGGTRTGADDTFVNEQNTQGNGSLVGDAGVVGAGTLIGGNDRFEDTWTEVLSGDVGNASSGPDGGTVIGGDDIFDLEDNNALPTLSVSMVAGDVTGNFVGHVVGGDDTIIIRNGFNTTVIVGDVADTEEGSGIGGDDTILMETTVPGRSFMNNSSGIFGDFRDFEGRNVASSGGDDTITLRNVNAPGVTGDALSVLNTVFTGGDDIIDIRGTFVTTPGGAALAPTVGTVSGDIFAMDGVDTELLGGDDTITVVDARVNQMAGDGSSIVADRIVGGDDAITYLYRSTASILSPVISGDALEVSTSSFTGGDDTIAVNITGSSGISSLVVYGDVSAATILPGPGGTAGVLNGDDVIRVTANSGQNLVLYGDMATIDTSATLSMRDGNDTITGGGGNDLIFGDTGIGIVSGMGEFASVTGGNDVLDGRGGDDTIIGGAGIDTVVFSLDQAVHVNLNGIVGTAAVAGNLVEAVGQGSDQLDGIENIIGSSRDDMLIGNGVFNVIEGGAGADMINGGGGSDTASYASSSAGVLVNLTAGIFRNGDAEGDVLVSIERLLGSAHNDTFVGTSGANYIDGGGGTDYMRGLGGSDIYVVDNTGDVVDESFTGSGGVDTVRSTVSVNLSNAVNFRGAIENIVLEAAGGGIGAVGNALDNTITGNTSGNVIGGGLGNDTLTGGAEYDRFVFNTALNAATNVDTITDYEVADQINLENSIFTALTSTGFLGASLFRNTNDGPVDASDRIIYDNATGALSYDVDGSGAAAAIQFAQLDAGLTWLDAGEFFVV